MAMTAGLPKGRGKMINRNFLYFIIILTFVAVVVVNYFIANKILWLLSLIPAFGISYLYPKWWGIVVVGILFFATILVTELVAYGGHFPLGHGQSLIYIAVTAGGIHAFFVYLRIKSIKLIKKLEKLSLIDDLTKIYNRRYLEMYMEKAIPFAERNGHPLTMVMFDIDHFKNINDSYGHNAGDMILQKLGKVIKETLRKPDVIIRTGGEEFLIILPDCSLNRGIKLAERIRTKVQSTKFVYNGNQIIVTISLGVTEYISGQDLNQLMECADMALYKAKESGRNKVMIK